MGQALIDSVGLDSTETGPSYTPPAAGTYPKLGTLTDNFNSPTLASGWVVTGAAVATGQNVQIGSDISAALTRNSWYELIGSQGKVSLTPSSGVGDRAGFMLQGFETGSQTGIEVNLTTGKLTAFVRVNGTDPAPVSINYTSKGKLFLRLREASGLVYYEYSSNGTTWQNVRTPVQRVSTTLAWLTQVKPVLYQLDV